jgi:putative ABC transport system permease protein
MIRNYFVSALNSLLKNKLFSLINISGLAVGLAASILIALYVRNETSYDRHWSNADSLYRVTTTIDSTGQNPEKAGLTSLSTLQPLREFFGSDVERAARIVPRNLEVVVGQERFSTPIAAVDADLTAMLDFDVLAGSLNASIADPASIALSEELATRIFADGSALGRSLTLLLPGTPNQAGQRVDVPRDYRVAAVYRLAPGNSVLAQGLPALVRLDHADINPALRGWTVNYGLTLLQLRADMNPAAFEARLPAFVDEVVDITSLNAGPGVKPSERFSLGLQRLTDVYLNSPFLSVVSSGNKSVVLAFSAIALLVLLIGCINFTVLSTARATQRAKEVAVRKVVGGSRLQLLAQFMGESLAVIVPALVLALALVELLLPALSARAGMVLSIPYDEVQTWLLLCGLTLLVAIAGGLYPALVLSGFRPALTLKPGHAHEKVGSTGLRGALVVFQFTVSIALMIATAVIYTQVQFSSNRDPGFQRQNMLLIENLQARAEVNAQKNALKAEILKLPAVQAASLSAHRPMENSSVFSTISLFYTPAGGSGAQQLVSTLFVDHDFFRTYRIPLLAGRDYAVDRDGPTLLFRPAADVEQLAGNIIINASAARQLGFADAADAVDKQIIADSRDTRKIVTFTIVGVVADTQFKSLRDAPRAETYVLTPGVTATLSVNYTGDAAAIRADVEEVWNRVMGDAELQVSYVDEAMSREFLQEQQEALMLVGFTALAILIACLGLFGSAAFTVETRTKEIGIRKTLGAEVKELVGLLLWQFSRPVILANVFAWPAAIWAMTRWLERFPYHLATADIVLLAAIAGLCALLIAALTVVNSTLRVATANPLHALRYE